MSRNTIGIALVGLLIVAAIALPASAAQANGNGNAYGKAGKIDSGLKDDLWAVHAKYRLQVYDTHVEGANEAVGVLESHGCPTEELADTVTAIGNERTPLSDALTNRDREALRDVNQELAKLWKQFREQVRESVRACSGEPVSVKTTAGAEL
jgi:hypothetical protein